MKEKKLIIYSKVQFPEISVIIPFHGEIKDLENCLEGLKDQDFSLPFEIIIAESGNNLEAELIAESVHNVSIVKSPSLMFPGKARNSGAEISKAKLLAFIDADCVPSENWLKEIYLSLKFGIHAVVGPVINLYPFHPAASVDNMFLFSDFPKHRSSKKIDHFAGCNFGITKKLYNEIGGFNETMNIGEDTEFSKSVLSKVRVFFNKKMIVKHSGRKEISQFKKHHENFGFYRGYYNLNVSSSKYIFVNEYLYPVYLGMRRLFYILIRTVQWNPIGIFRIIFFSPFLILGISAWIKGYKDGYKKFDSEKNRTKEISLSEVINKDY